MDKREIRRKIKSMRSMLLEQERMEAAERVFSLLEHTAGFMVSDNILIYHSLPDELPTQQFLKKWNGVKHFFLPRVNGVNLEILPYDESRLELGSFYIEEPTGDNVVSPEEIDLIVVPGVAYDKNRNRLGRGKGFYDRLLATTKALKIGVGYDFQLLDEIPTEEHDVKMDFVITPRRFISHIAFRK